MTATIAMMTGATTPTSSTTTQTSIHKIKAPMAAATPSVKAA
jgi:hypothetical protein